MSVMRAQDRWVLAEKKRRDVMIKMGCLCVHLRDHRGKRYAEEMLPLGLDSSLKCAGNGGRKLENVCLEKPFKPTLFLAGKPVGKVPSCLCVQIPEAGSAGGGTSGCSSAA